jgi:hypothetical protein
MKFILYQCMFINEKYIFNNFGITLYDFNCEI